MEQEKYIRRQTVHMALLSGLFWFGFAMTNYWSVYMKSVGFSAGLVGTLNSICSATSIVSIPLWGIVADKTRSIKKVAAFLIIMAAGLWTIIPLCHTFFPGAVLPFFILTPLCCFFKNPTITMHENLLVRNGNELGIEYGKFRWIGSVMSACGAAVIYFVAARAGYSSTFWMFGLCLIPPIFLTLISRDPKGTQAPGSDGSAGKKNTLDLPALFRSRSYLIFLVFTLVYYLAHDFEIVFIPFFMDEIGIGSGNYTLIAGFSALLEVPMLLIMQKLRRSFSLRKLLMTVPFFHVIACLMFSFVVRGWIGMILATVFMGIGNGIYIGTVYNYCYEIAPDSVKASAQAFYSTVCEIGSVVGSLIGGFIMDAIGGGPFFFLTAAVYLCAFFFLVFSGLKKKAKAV